MREGEGGGERSASASLVDIYREQILFLILRFLAGSIERLIARDAGNAPSTSCARLGGAHLFGRSRPTRFHTAPRPLESKHCRLGGGWKFAPANWPPISPELQRPR